MAKHPVLTFIIPTQDPRKPRLCLHETAELSLGPNTDCGCPQCLSKRGLTLIYNADDIERFHKWIEKTGEAETQKVLQMCRIKIVSIDVAKLCPHLWVEGYEPPADQ